jgi:hypothetical protein
VSERHLAIVALLMSKLEGVTESFAEGGGSLMT